MPSCEVSVRRHCTALTECWQRPSRMPRSNPSARGLFRKISRNFPGKHLPKKPTHHKHIPFAFITCLLAPSKVPLHSPLCISRRARQSKRTREHVDPRPTRAITTPRLCRSFHVGRANSLRKCTPIFKTPPGALHPVHSTAR